MSESNSSTIQNFDSSIFKSLTPILQKGPTNFDPNNRVSTDPQWLKLLTFADFYNYKLYEKWWSADKTLFFKDILVWYYYKIKLTKLRSKFLGQIKFLGVPFCDSYENCWL